MNDQPKKVPNLADEVDRRAKRKLKARRRGTPTVWSGLGMMGLIGWSVAIPTLLGAALGIWLDDVDPSDRSWTLALLSVGLAVGCINAWHWVTKESEAIQKDDADE